MALVHALGTGAAAADDQEGSSVGSFFDKKFTLSLGGFFPAINSTFSLNSSDGSSGGDIDLQDDLGFDDGEPSPWIHFAWRFQPRHQLQVEWFNLSQDGTIAQVGPLPPIGDLEILDASVTSKIDFNLGRATYGYSILREENYDLSFMVGAHIATTKATVTATGDWIYQGVPDTGTQTESTSTFTFPLPHIGGEFVYEFAPRWVAKFTLLGFYLEVSDYTGFLLEVDGGISYQLSKHFGIGGGIKYFNLNLQAQKTAGGAEFDYQFLGPAIFGYASF